MTSKICSTTCLPQSEYDNFCSNQFHIIAGPCAVESEKQIEDIAKMLLNCKVLYLRGGAFKPRTSPKDFQGLGLEGLKLLNIMGKKYQLKIVTEILDTRDVELGVEYADIIQIGSRNMFNSALLKEVGKTRKTIILKRGIMATLDEFLLAADYVIQGGNENIILCERGIRTFENSVRNTLDISTMAIIKNSTKFPLIVDLSHSLGRKDILLPVAKAVLAMGINGIMVETHNDPNIALSDAAQQLSFNEFKDFLGNLNCKR